ncbi:MAG: SUMF1/EgtB/PvdO family nonheme iron enzyme [Gammaproteobacteria bacterium]|nr:SUMF1/EgtB/PvdO family nonheme iron enzyme [Gammaproteobacteria bacterium]MCW8910973.1 SUMF1/EgtB/PvdO family nonheme iron enzyme [Gammaproteobacteria bacterium]MCW9005726.1 SUMF1/EgtB/PvdO family nonheme iron enzyme [Gammaproteobacteria bacterium]
MSTSLTTMIRLRGIQNKMRQLVESLDDRTFRMQFHSDLSPAGWHLGHCAFIEDFWLHEIIQGNKKFTKKLKKIYLPENCPIHKRGKKLPDSKKLLNEVHQQQDENDLLLIEMIPPFSDHPLFKDEYIQNYIIQHYARHYEIMQMIINQAGLQLEDPDFIPQKPLNAKSITIDAEQIPSGDYEIGGEPPFAYDNELPKHTVKLKTYNIAIQPVSNAEYLAFMEDQGYTDTRHWSEEAQQWLIANGVSHPEHWRQNKNHEWYGLNDQGAFELNDNDPVYGINHYEASAFAHWANARLPHEHEWETCAKLERLQNTGNTWEWCTNIFKAYNDFTAFPDNKSESSFDNKHYVLKGATQFTRPEIKRASYRNHYTPEKRHIFAGLRLVFE